MLFRLCSGRTTTAEAFLFPRSAPHALPLTNHILFLFVFNLPVGANRCVRPFLFAWCFVGQTHRSAPTLLVFFVVVVWANRCVRPCCCIAGVFWADTPVCPYGAGAVILPPPAGTPSINRGRLKFLYFTLNSLPTGEGWGGAVLYFTLNSLPTGEGWGGAVLVISAVDGVH